MRVSRSVDEEQRPDQVVGGEHVLGTSRRVHCALRLRRGRIGEVEAGGGLAGILGLDGGKAGFDRTAVFDGHGGAPGTLQLMQRLLLAVPGTAARDQHAPAVADAAVVVAPYADLFMPISREAQHMSVTGPTPPPQPAMSDKQIVVIVYILYLASYITGITALIGVIIAHVQVGSADPSSPPITAFRSGPSGSASFIS